MANTGSTPVEAGAAHHIEGTVNVVVDVDFVEIGNSPKTAMCVYCCCDVCGIFYK